MKLSELIAASNGHCILYGIGETFGFLVRCDSPEEKAHHLTNLQSNPRYVMEQKFQTFHFERGCASMPYDLFVKALA